MYLIALHGLDYIWISLLLIASFILAYKFRRSNSTSELFLYAPSKLDTYESYLGSFGIIEIVLFGIIGGYLGFNAIYLISLTILLTFIIKQFILNTIKTSTAVNFLDYIGLRFNKFFMLIVALLAVILLISCMGLSLTLMFKLLQSVMGFGFINNSMALFAFTVIIILIGGRIGIINFKFLNVIVLYACFILLIGVCWYKLDSLMPIIRNLTNLAQAQQHSSSYYLSPLNLNYQSLLYFVPILISIMVVRLISTNTFDKNSQSITKGIVTFALIAIIVLPSIFALATQLGNGTKNDIVTLTAQLPNGQIGYIVKAEDTSQQQKNTSPGIIPPLLNPKTNMIEPNKYNYDVATIIAFRHYLPNGMLFICVLILLSAFINSIAEYMLLLGRITLRNILLPLKMLESYEQIGEIWAIQISVVGYTGLTLICAYFMFLYYDLMFFVNCIAYGLVIPLLICLVIMLLTPRHRN
jgi:hypothetical protein